MRTYANGSGAQKFFAAFELAKSFRFEGMGLFLLGRGMIASCEADAAPLIPALKRYTRSVLAREPRADGHYRDARYFAVDASPICRSISGSLPTVIKPWRGRSRSATSAITTAMVSAITALGPTLRLPIAPPANPVKPRATAAIA
jgi:hypothetical protein